MTLPVGDVVELVRPDRAIRLRRRQALSEPPGDLHVVVWIRVRDGRHLDQLRAREPQHVLLFLALRFGNDDHGSEAQHVRHERETDSGIARRSLDDDAARAQETSSHRILDDEQGRPILDGLARIHELRLSREWCSPSFPTRAAT